MKKITEIYKDGKQAYLVFTPNERIYFFVGKDRVYFERRYGFVREYTDLPLALTWGEIARVISLLKLWGQQKNSWAEFGFNLKPAGFGARYYYLPPNSDKKIWLGEVGVGVRWQDAFEFQSDDEVCRYKKSKRIKEGIYETGEIWRKGEKAGNPEGEVVGKQFLIGKDINVELKRSKAGIYRNITPEELTVLEPRLEEEYKKRDWHHRINVEFQENESFAELLRMKSVAANLAKASLSKHEITEALPH